MELTSLLDATGEGHDQGSEDTLDPPTDEAKRVKKIIVDEPGEEDVPIGPFPYL